MRPTKVLLASLFVTQGWLFAVDFTHFSDICDSTPTQSCPNKPEEVKALQHLLNSDKDLYLYIKENGRWDKGVKEAVILFQEHYGIRPASGYVGSRSRMVLQKIASGHKPRPRTAPPSHAEKKPKSKLPSAPPVREFVLYKDMCDNTIKGNHCPDRVIEVSNLQILLNADPNLNVNISADGKWGKGTQRAVVAFQKFYNISPANGYIGAQTKKVLDRVAGAMVAHAVSPKKKNKKKKEKKKEKSTNSKNGNVSAITEWKAMCEATETDTCPNRPEDVRGLQAWLNKALHLRLVVDGKWGTGTKQAVIVFQKTHGISPATGYVGAKTRRAMQKAK